MTERMVFDVTTPEAKEVDRMPTGLAEFISWPRLASLLAMHLCNPGEVVTHIEAGSQGVRVRVEPSRR